MITCLCWSALQAEAWRRRGAEGAGYRLAPAIAFPDSSPTASDRSGRSSPQALCLGHCPHAWGWKNTLLTWVPRSLLEEEKNEFA